MRALAGLASGLLFGVGLVLSGMAQPAKVMGFLDFTGAWDPSLMFVMLGAIATFAPLYRWVARNGKPRYAAELVVFKGRQLDAPLLVGAAIFGVGWGLSGYCPGPALVSAGTGAVKALSFGFSMIAGMLVFRTYERWRLVRKSSVMVASNGVEPELHADHP